MAIPTALADLEPQVANARDYWTGWGAAYRDEGDPTLFHSGVPHPVLNGVIRLHDADLATVLAETRRRFDGVPWLWQVGPDSRPGLADELLAHRATRVGATPIMAIELDELSLPDRPADLVVEQVTEPTVIRDWAHAYAPCFGVTPDHFDAVSQLEIDRGDEGGDLLRFAGRIDGRIVGSSVLFTRHGVAGIYVVATAPEFRRRGIAAHLTGVALRAGQDRGARIGTLQASEAGAPVYLRMGFSTVGEYRLFQIPPR